MKKTFLSAFIILALISITPYAQTARETWYVSPLYQLSDPTGRPLSEIIDAELTKMLIDKRLGSLKKVSYETDTTFSKYIQKDSISRDSDGFLEADAMKKIHNKM